MKFHVTLDRRCDLSEEERAELTRLTQAVYPPDEFADWPGRKIEWAPPDWLIRVTGDAGTLVASVGLLIRQARAGDRDVSIGGIGGVKTHPDARRQGHFSSGMKKAIEFFDEQSTVDFALLVCEDRLVPLYSQFGFRVHDGRLLTCQFGEQCDYTFSPVMVRDVRSAAPAGSDINLLGPPW